VPKPSVRKVLSSACHPRREIWARSRLCIKGSGRKIHHEGISVAEEKRGAIEGPIRISLDSPLFLFNDMALPTVSSKSLRFQSVLFSIPTAPTNFLVCGNDGPARLFVIRSGQNSTVFRGARRKAFAAKGLPSFAMSWPLTQNCTLGR
jgi:hypothetical protein